MSRIFHLLPESESFSQHSRRPLGRWVSNVVEEDGNAIVLAPSSDGSWPIDVSRVQVVKGLATYKSLLEWGGHLLPQRLRFSLLRRLLEASLHDLKAGDTVWIHDRPDFGLALAPLVRARGARLFLHFHTAHMVQASLAALHGFQPDCYVFNSEALEHDALTHFPSMAPTEVLSGGLDYRAFFPSSVGGTAEADGSANQTTVVFSAHLARKNDLKVFLDAMELLRVRGVPVCGSVVGGVDTPGTTPEAQAPLVLKEKNVSYESFSTAAAFGKKLRASKLFCIPSTWHESASLHMLEALACGLPVLTTQSDSAPDAQESAPGILVVANAAERLAEVIQSLVEDSAARNQFAKDAYGTYTHSLMWSLTRDAYHSVLGSHLRPEHLRVPLSLAS